VLKSRARKTIVGRVAQLPADRRTLPSPHQSICIGRLIAWDDKGPLVDFEGNPQGPVIARQSTPAPQLRLRAQSAVGQEVVLLVGGRPGQSPILLGFLQPAPGPADIGGFEARVDGRRVEIDGRDEIVLRCGEASITLRRNGRVLIRGIQVETRAAGVNRIKGGSVAIN
jgi:hypothetical protein